MKTSSKILLIAFGLMLGGIILVSTKLRNLYYGDRVEGCGLVISQEMEIKPFKTLDISNGIRAIADTSLKGTLVIEADSSLMEHIRIVQSDGKLRIFTEKRLSKSSVIKVFLPIEDISRISVSSSASFKSDPIIEGKSLDLNLSSGGTLNFEIKTKDCRIDASSGGVAKIRGETDNLTINISSGGVIKGASLWAKTARVDGSSGGVTTVGVKDELRINLSSGSVLSYHGSPRIVSENISSGGVVKRE